MSYANAVGNGAPSGHEHPGSKENLRGNPNSFLNQGTRDYPETSKVHTDPDRSVSARPLTPPPH